MEIHRVQIRPDYDIERLKQDVADRGWIADDLARAAGVSHMSVSRFLRGIRVSPRMVGRFASALGYSPRRYMRRAA